MAAPRASPSSAVRPIRSGLELDCDWRGEARPNPAHWKCSTCRAAASRGLPSSRPRTGGRPRFLEARRGGGRAGSTSPDSRTARLLSGSWCFAEICMTGRARESWRFAAASPLLLAGLLPLDPAVCQNWSLAGRWLLPVADPYELGRPGPIGEPAFQVTRNVGSSRNPHTGADLSNRRGGDSVRAAAHGIVVAAGTVGNGYGWHVVIAHRQPDGSLVFSVYAHLVPKSLRVEPGQPVWMGQVLGRVGSSGVATSPHLHFEVREPERWDERWEKTRPVDPVEFVMQRLPTRQRDSTWARPYFHWAECAGLVSSDESPAELVSRQRWQRILAAARCRRDDIDGPLLPPVPASDDRTDFVTWHEVVRDLQSSMDWGLCLPPDSTSTTTRAAHCSDQLGEERPLRSLSKLEHRKAKCTLGQVTLLLDEAAAP